MCLARSLRLAAMCLVVVAASSCSNPEKQKVRHLQRGDQYVAEKRDDAAIIEYLNAVKLDPMYGEARFKLAQAYERMNDLRAAFPEYIRAADSLPDDRNAQGKATQLLLVAGRFEEARTRAAALVKKDPNDIDAVLLHANALAGLQDPATAIAQIEDALKVSPGNSQAFLNLGAARVQQGELNEAEAAFRQAVSLDPAAVGARLALANFLWTSGRAPEAETTLKEALGNEPSNVLANRMLGALYLATGRAAQAEQPLKTVAEMAKAPGARLQLADFYASVGRTTDAVGVLSSLSAEPATHAEAEVRLAAMDYAGGRLPDAYKRLDAVLAKMPNNTQALVLKARWLTGEDKLDEALKSARAAVDGNPESASAHFALASVYSRRGYIPDAMKSYNEVLRINPRAAAAQVELSRLSLTRGDSTAALRYAGQAREAAPSSVDARLALTRSLIASRDFARAESELALLLQGAPDSAAAHTVSGMFHASRRNETAARRSYERALELSPGYLEALAGLTYLELAAKAPARALARLEPEVAKQPTSAPLLALAGQAYLAAGDHVRAEQSLRRAVSVEPRFTIGYAMLAQFYTQQGRLEEARSQWEAMSRRDPSAVGPRTMVGVLLEAQGKREEARKMYEGTVSGNENAPVAANNLAFMYAEQGTNLDVALQLAQAAKRGLPDDPNVDDTIGWVYYKKDLPALAVGPLQDSIRKRDNPTVLYHLGLAYAKLGDKAKARDALETAIRRDPTLDGAEARRAMASVSQ